MSYLPLPSFFSQLHRHPSPPPPYYPVCNQVCSQPPRAGMLSQPFCCLHAWREVLSPFLIPKAQLPPINSTQPPMMACIRKWPFFFFLHVILVPLIAQDAGQAQVLALSAPAGPHPLNPAIGGLLVTSYIACYLDSWRSDKLKLLRLGGQPKPAGSLCPFEGWDAEH